jgi:hypothetical protein
VSDLYPFIIEGCRAMVFVDDENLAIRYGAMNCENMHKKLLLKDSAEKGVYGWSPRQATLTFKCLDESDPEYAQGGHTP